MKRVVALIALIFAFCAFASAAPLSLIFTPDRAEIAFTLKPLEISIGDNFAGTIDMETGKSSFVHDLTVGAKLYLPAPEDMNAYLFGNVGLLELGRNENKNFKIGLGTQYNLADNFAVFGEFGVDVTRAGEELELTTTSNSIGLRFGF